MSGPLPALMFAVFVWWFSTGVILVLVGLRAAWHRAMVWGTAPLALAACAIAVAAADRGDAAAAYLGFAAAIAVWGWFELSFLTGVLTGPNQRFCAPGTPSARRFWQALMTLAWHELALAAMAGGLFAASIGAAGPAWGAWTFLVLFVARISAKLNVFLGVPHLTEAFVPEALRHMKSYFGQAPMNLLFPVSVTGGTLAVVGLVLLALDRPEHATGAWLLAALSALAVLEHWFLVLPVRDSALWAWMLRAGDARRGVTSRGGKVGPTLLRGHPAPVRSE